MAIVAFLYVIIAIALVNTLSIEFVLTSAPTVCVCGWSASRLFPQMGNITMLIGYHMPSLISHLGLGSTPSPRQIFCYNVEIWK